LAANIYLNRLDAYFLRKYGWNVHQRRYRLEKGMASLRLVRFADDFVILVKGTREHAEALKEETAEVLRKDLRMELSLEKTRITPVTEGFDFLGHHIVLKPNRADGPVGVRVYPSKKSLRAVQEKVKQITSSPTLTGSLAQVISRLNPVLRGWTNYFRFDHSKKTFSYLRAYTWRRVYGWMRKKHRGLPARVLRRRYFPGWTFREGNWTLFNAGAVKVERYRYRGARIPTPWNGLAETLTRNLKADRMTDEPRRLMRMEAKCAI
jgi:RNA-directed DNA polymerase